MTTTTDDPQLPPTRAHKIVSHAVECARRAGVARFELAAARPLDGFAHEYDTLVVLIQPQHRHLQRHVRREQLPNADNVRTGACWLREALLLIYAVSGCRRFSFHENPVFWTEVLSLKLSPVVSITSHGFPRVALEWDPRHVVSLPEYTKIVSQRLLATSVLDLFTTSSPLPVSPKGLMLLADAYTWSRTRSRDHHEIECIVVVGFARVASATKALVYAVLSAANAAVSNSSNDTLTWIGVRLVGSADVQYAHHANLSTATRLCEMLPPSLSVEIQLPTSEVQLRAPLAPSLKRAFVAFLAPAIGVRDTEWHGRLVVLDLTYRVSNPTIVIPALDFAALGTLLPLSRSLQKLCVAVASTSDLLWLVYAIAHPLTRTSMWRTLYLDGQHYEVVFDWQQVQRLVTSPSLFATLWTLLTQPTSSVTVSETPSGTCDGFVWRTATVVSDATVLSMDKASTLAQLVVGQSVDVCDTTTTINELMIEFANADLDDVAVVVAGVGIGWIHKRHLSDISDTYFDGQPRSCLTTLALGRNLVPTSDLVIGLRILGSSLKHLRVHTNEVTVRDVARACPLLESLEMPHAYSHPPLSGDHATACAMLPSLRDVGVVCDVSSPDACFDLLYRLPALRSLRLVCRMTFLPQDWNRVDQHVTALIAAKTKTLRSLMLITRYRQHESVAPLADLAPDGGCSSPMKRALLSVVRAAAQDDSDARHALASLGADVLPLVFAFVGTNLTFAEVVGDDLWPKAW